ncbi:MAG: CDP-glycerol glycerophosphotransferase family protein [Lachnospiraceae bacterium]|nr:CDP-glycerol glycerophosphotransferase family protein [Lachnospiraceae bacterium]
MFRSIVKRIVFGLIYPCRYKISSRKKINNRKVVFVETHEDYITDNFKLLYEEFKKLGYEVNVCFLKVSSSSWGTIIKKSIKLIDDIGDASYIFLDESNSLFGSFKLREETQLIQLWHACGAFKKWGYSVADKSFGDDKKSLDRYSGHRNYSLVTVSGKEVCWAYEEAFGLSQESGIVKPLGVSRTDMYFDEGYINKAKNHLSNLPIDVKGKQIITYLPTFRGSIDKAKGPDCFDIKSFEKYRDKYVFLIKNHPFVKDGLAIPKDFQDFCVNAGADITIEDLIIASDICITDYSSVVFEYSLMNKPIIFFAYDIDEYEKERGFYYSYKKFVPGPVCDNMKELVDAIDNIDKFDYERLNHFKELYMNGCDGHATKRILDYINAI